MSTHNRHFHDKIGKIFLNICFLDFMSGGRISYELKNDFELVTVNKSSVFESLGLYCSGRRYGCSIGRVNQRPSKLVVSADSSTAVPLLQFFLFACCLTHLGLMEYSSFLFEQVHFQFKGGSTHMVDFPPFLQGIHYFEFIFACWYTSPF